MSPLVWRALVRHLLRHPWQLALAMVGIALGVAVVLAVDLANSSARRSFALAAQQLTGVATHQIVGTGGKVPQAFYRDLRINLGVRASAPVIAGYAALANEPGAQIQILGVDPFVEAPMRTQSTANGYTAQSMAALLTVPNAALLSADLAAPRADLAINRGGRVLRLQRVGTLVDPGLTALAITDIGTAQTLLELGQNLSHIDLVLPKSPAGVALAERIRRSLPAGLRLVSAGEREQAIGALSDSFSLNLTVMSLLALLVGMFLIYNTMLFAVVQRQPLLGRLRALGVSRRELFTAVIGEALLIGGIGTLLGGGLGMVLGYGLLHLVTRTMNDLYFTLTVSTLHISSFAMGKALFLGLLVSAIAAWLPAREAASVPPRALLSRASLEMRWVAALPRLLMVAAATLLAGILMLRWSSGLIGGFAALFLLVLGCALSAPPLIGMLARGLRLLAWRPLAAMAIGSVARDLSRTGVAVAALMVAFATTVGVGVMIDSFRAGVIVWLEQLLTADIYVAPASSKPSSDTALQPEVIAKIGEIPEVAAISLYRRSETWVAGKPVALTAVDLAPAAQQGYRLREGDAATVWRALDEGAVLISEPLAYRQRLHVGDDVTLTTRQGERQFPVAGVFYDYGSEHGRILITRAVYLRHWDDPVVNSAAIYAVPGASIAALRQRLEAGPGRLQALSLRNHRDIFEFTLAVFDRTFTITAVLRLLAIIVACVGMLSALLALLLERGKEFAVLRTLGLSPAESAALVGLQSGLLGLLAGLLALPVGLMLAAVLVFVINRRAFGWTLPFQVDPWILAQALGWAILAALLASLYPIWRLNRVNLAQALRTE